MLTTYYVNDLHGALLRQQNAIGQIWCVILADSNVENSLFIAGGDMLQGQVISNYFEGASTIDILNQMNLDAFVIGNHEFDWGLQTVLQYFNGENKDLQAKYPLLGANVIEKESGQIPNGIKPYVIVEKGGYKIAIIGRGNWTN